MILVSGWCGLGLVRLKFKSHTHKFQHVDSISLTKFIQNSRWTDFQAFNPLFSHRTEDRVYMVKSYNCLALLSVCVSKLISCRLQANLICRNGKLYCNSRIHYRLYLLIFDRRSRIQIVCRSLCLRFKTLQQQVPLYKLN